LRAEYTLLYTQRWILQPELETNLYGKSDPRDDTGAGISDMQLGLRLRYDATRQFAPYVGIVWVRHFGETADWIQQRREPVFDTQIVVGLHAWF
jgi:copper resistance protein B